MLKGEHISLTPFTAKNLDKTRQWANDQEICVGILRVLPVTEYDQEQWFVNLCHDLSKIVLSVQLLENEKHVGNSGFYDIDYLHRRAELWMLIGDKTCWGKGYGRQIVQLMLSYGFDSLNLNRIFLHVRHDHPRAVKLYENAGFKTEGVLREQYFMQGKYINVLVMSILRSDYDANK